MSVRVVFLTGYVDHPQDEHSLGHNMAQYLTGVNYMYISICIPEIKQGSLVLHSEYKTEV